MTKVPTAQWAQRDDVVYITFQICDCQNAKVKYEGNKMDFSGSANNQDYASSLELFDEIDAEKSVWVKEGRGIFCTAYKKTSCYWPRLMKEKSRQHWLSVDFQRWKDEDDSSCDEGSEGPAQPNFMEMMNQMGGDGGMPSMKGMEDSDDEIDSDDEDIPKLENSAGDANSEVVA